MTVFINQINLNYDMNIIVFIYLFNKMHKINETWSFFYIFIII